VRAALTVKKVLGLRPKPRQGSALDPQGAMRPLTPFPPLAVFLAKAPASSR